MGTVYDKIDFEPHDYGWRSLLPADKGTFFGLPVTVDVATRHVPTEPANLPPIFEEQRRLISSILEQLASILQEAEKQLEAYYDRVGANFEDIKPMLADPRMWIRLSDTEDLRDPIPRNDSEWTFVVGFEESFDFGHHIEFDLVKCVDVWAGG